MSLKEFQLLYAQHLTSKETLSFLVLRKFKISNNEIRECLAIIIFKILFWLRETSQGSTRPDQVKIFILALTQQESQTRCQNFYSIFAQFFLFFSFFFTFSSFFFLKFFKIFQFFEEKRGCVSKRQKCKVKIESKIHPPD